MMDMAGSFLGARRERGDDCPVGWSLLKKHDMMENAMTTITMTTIEFT
jgi:hypothetical protein